MTKIFKEKRVSKKLLFLGLLFVLISRCFVQNNTPGQHVWRAPNNATEAGFLCDVTSANVWGQCKNGKKLPENMSGMLSDKFLKNVNTP